MRKILAIFLLFLYHVAAYGCYDTYEVVSVEQLLPKANLGDSEAQIRLAEEYYEGRRPCGGGQYIGPTQDFEKAFFWYQKAADQGNVEAQFKLGVMLLNGEGVAPNREEALRWLQRAADSGHKVARSLISIGL